MPRRLLYPRLLLLCGFLTLPRTRGTWRQRRLLCTCICTTLLSWITHAHLVPLCVTKRRLVHIILDPGYVEYELDVLMVWKLSRPKRDSNPRYPAWKSSALTTWPPSPHTQDCLTLSSLANEVDSSTKFDHVHFANTRVYHKLKTE